MCFKKQPLEYCYALFSAIFSPVHSSIDEELTTENTDGTINMTARREETIYMHYHKFTWHCQRKVMGHK